MKREHKNLWCNINQTTDEADREIIRIVTEYGECDNNGGFSLDLSDKDIRASMHIDDENGYETIYAEILSVSVDDEGGISVAAIDTETGNESYNIELDSVYKHLDVYDAVVSVEDLEVKSFYEDMDSVFNDKETHPTDLIGKVMDRLADLYNGQVEQAISKSKDAVYELGMELFNQSVKLLEENSKLVKQYAECFSMSADEYWWDDSRDDLVKEFLVNRV